MKENEYVKTAIRWRPVDQQNDVVIEKVNDKIISFGNQLKTYMFDHVIDSSDQGQVYDILVKPLVEKAFEGYDCTFLASGQTGSGKTYTMGFESSVNFENNGITPRILSSIFSYEKAERVKVLVSFVEVYNDQAFDLLGQNPQNPFFKKDHRLSEPTKKSVQDEKAVLVLLAQGTKNRRVRETKMNATSSRSHAVFTIYLGIEQTENNIREPVINLVDLAGSECVRKTGNTGTAHAEGRSINGSLSAFKRVITAMSSGAKHIPFRDSVITTILKNSLKVNCYLTLLGCVSPFKKDYGETLSTLNFVAEAKQIKRTPQVNAVINEFQKSKTPVKASFQTPNSSARFANSFKRPYPISTNLNQSSFSSKLFSEPRRLIILNSAQKNFRKNSISNSTTKKTSISNIRNMRSSFGGKKPRVVSSLFPTASRKAIEDSIQHDESMGISFSEASTSSALDFRKLDSPVKMARARPSTVPEDLLKIVASLQEMVKDKPFDEKMDQTINYDTIKDMLGKLQTKLNDQFPTMETTFHATPEPTGAQPPNLPTVIENEFSKATSNTEMDVPSDCLENELAPEQIASDSPRKELISDPITSVNVSVAFDNVEKQIVFEVENPSDEATIIDLAQDTSKLKENVNISNLCKTSGHLNTESPNKPLKNHDISHEAMISCITILDSPQVSNHHQDENVRTPIGKLVIRKIAPSLSFENTQYAVESINRSKRPPSLDSFCYEPPDISYRFPKRSAIASKAKYGAHDFPYSPRVILHRIDSIQDYQKHYEDSYHGDPQPALKAKRQVKRTKSTRIKEVVKKTKTQVTSTDSRTRILHNLNNGSEKELQKLCTIGVKTAYQIFNYRNAKGPFESIDGLLKMPCWTKKLHEKFIAANIFD